MRLYLLVGVLEAVAIGASGLISPQGSMFEHLLPLTVTPLNGRVIGAFYLAGAIGLIASAAARRAVDARIFVWGFGIIAGSLLIVTLAYWDEMTVARTPVGWIASYIIDPLASIACIIALRLDRAAISGRHRLTPLFLVAAVALLATGMLLLLAPGTAVDAWPWKISVVLARLYSMFFIGFAAGAALCAFEVSAAARRAFSLAMLGLGLLVLIASAQHRDRFTHGVGTWLWAGGFAAAALAGAAALIVSDLLPARARRPGIAPAPSLTTPEG